MNDTWWRTSKYQWDIEKVEVFKVTDRCLWLKRWPVSTHISKTSKHSDWEDYWETRAAAIAHLKNRAATRIAEAEKLISEMRDVLKRLGDETNPTPDIC